MNQHKNPIACVAKSIIPPGTVLPSGATEAQCRACATVVIVSPSSRQLEAEAIGLILCQKCAVESVQGANSVAVVMTPEQRAELKKWQREVAERN